MATHIVFVVLLALVSLLLPVFAAEYFVKPNPSSTTCPTQSCLILNEYATNATRYFTSGSRFTLLEGEHYLDVTLNLTGVTGVTLSGGDKRTKIAVSEEGGITWTSSREITISLLDITYEGDRMSLSHSALRFENSHSIEIVNVRFTGSQETYSQAIRLFNSTANFANCSFMNGHGENGGAMYLETSMVTFSGTNLFSNNVAELSGGALYATHSTLGFSGTNTFLQNKAHSIFVGISYTGGAAVFTLLSHALFTGYSIFRENGPVNRNVTLYGGAMSIYNSTLVILNRALFIGNFAADFDDSGVIDSIFSNISLEGQMTFTDNLHTGPMWLYRCNLTCSGQINFTNNLRYGTAVYSERSNVTFSGEINFINNTAIQRQGGAVYAINSFLLFRGEISFVNNRADKGGGAIFTESSYLTCEGTITFSNNSAELSGGGGVYALNSVVTVSGSTSFMDNMAGMGGGIGLEGSAELVFQSPVAVTFTRNEAKSVGGGVLFIGSNPMAQCEEIVIDRTCFFKIESANSSSTDITLYFIENFAGRAGSVLYGGSLQFCSVLVNNKQLENDSLEFLQSISTFSHIDNSTSYISSDPLKICFCNNGEPDCSEGNITMVTVRRGELFTFSVIIVGQLDMPVPSTLRTYIKNEENTTELRQLRYVISSTCTDVGFRLKSAEVSKTLALYPDGPCGNTKNTRRESSIIFAPCPAGFDLEGNGCVCEHRLLDLNSTIKCNVDTSLIERPENSWIQPIWGENRSYDGFLLHPNCPLEYCKPASSITLLNFSLGPDVSDSLCAPQRSGVLCGQCERNYSLTLSKFHCQSCENRYISLLLYFGFAGVALIAILLGLHMTVAAGTINGLILYANIVNVNRAIFFPPEDTNVLTVFISWLNLDFGIETCFFDGLDFYTYAWLQYAFPLYLWFLIGAIVLSSRLSARVGQLFGSNPVAVLATVILMSYTKILQTSILVLSYTNIEYPDGTKKKVWLFDANITYFKGKHVILSLVALSIILLLLIPYFFLLLLGYRLQAYSGKKRFSWFNRFKPFLDAYYAPYRTNTRYWTGFMLLTRGCLYLAFTINALSNSKANLVAISSVFTAIAIIPWLSNRIYEKLYNDVLEASFILNICILSTATYQVADEKVDQAIVTYLSVGIAFVQFVGIVGCHFYSHIKTTNAIQFFRSRLKEPLSSSGESEIGQTQKKVVTRSVVELREPLLEDESYT